MMRLGLLLILVFTLSLVNAGPKRVQVHCLPKWQKQAAALGTWYPLEKGDSLQFGRIRFYLGNIQLINNGRVVWMDSVAYHLLDAGSPATLSISLDPPNKVDYDTMRFSIGTDSITNAGGVKGGDLDPMHGMYWAWQSGYINVQLEGHSNKSKDPKKEFQFHLGGFLPPDATIQFLEMPIKSTTSIDLALQLDVFFDAIDWDRGAHVMSPSNEAVRLSKRFAEAIQFKVK